MRSDTLEHVANYVVLVVIGLAVAWYDQRLFSVYAFMVVVGLLTLFSARLWKLIRVTHATTNAKLLIIAKRLGVRDADFDEYMAELRTTDPVAYKLLERDLRDLGS